MATSSEGIPLAITVKFQFPIPKLGGVSIVQD